MLSFQQVGIQVGVYDNNKKKKIGTQCVHVSAIRKLLLDMLLSYTVQNVGFVGFVWCHVCFAALKINETVGKNIKKPQR